MFWRKRTEEARASKADGTFYSPDTYGHPHHPDAYLAKQLPKAPDGYLWEVKIAPGASGNPALQLDLVRLTDGEHTLIGEIDLTIQWRCGTYSTTWQEKYSGYSDKSNDELFREAVICPLVSKAISAKFAVEGSDGVIVTQGGR